MQVRKDNNNDDDFNIECFNICLQKICFMSVNVLHGQLNHKLAKVKKIGIRYLTVKAQVSLLNKNIKQKDINYL